MAEIQHTQVTPEQGTHAQDLHHNATLALCAVHAIAESIRECPGIPHRAAGLAEALHARAATDFEHADCEARRAEVAA